MNMKDVNFIQHKAPIQPFLLYILKQELAYTLSQDY